MWTLQKNSDRRGKGVNFIGAAFLLLIILGFSGCSADTDLQIQTGKSTEYTGDETTSGSKGTESDASHKAEPDNGSAAGSSRETAPGDSLEGVPDDISIPAYSGEAYVEINNNMPYFTEKDYGTESFESYSPLDALGRCGAAYANIGQDIMPAEEKGSIGQIKPSGWHTVKYDIVDGKYLYNRCHLIGYQLTGENANEQNLITGTRYLNVTGMLPFENKVADYVKETDHHVLYRVTPMFEGDNLLADGVLMEAWSVEDSGEGICFNVFVYNVQPGVVIDLATGDSHLESEESGGQNNGRPENEGTAASETGRSENEGAVASDSSHSEGEGNVSVAEPVQENSGLTEEPAKTQEPAPIPEGTDYILNTNTKKFHYPYCSSVGQMAEKNKQAYTGNREEIIGMGYDPCKRCNP